MAAEEWPSVPKGYPGRAWRKAEDLFLSGHRRSVPVPAKGPNPLELLFGYKLSSLQTGYNLVDLASPLSLAVGLFHAEHCPAAQIPFKARVGLFIGALAHLD